MKVASLIITGLLAFALATNFLQAQKSAPDQQVDGRSDDAQDSITKRVAGEIAVHRAVTGLHGDG